MNVIWNEASLGVQIVIDMGTGREEKERPRSSAFANGSPARPAISRAVSPANCKHPCRASLIGLLPGPSFIIHNVSGRMCCLTAKLGKGLKCLPSSPPYMTWKTAAQNFSLRVQRKRRWSNQPVHGFLKLVRIEESIIHLQNSFEKEDEGVPIGIVTIEVCTSISSWQPLKSWVVVFLHCDCTRLLV